MPQGISQMRVARRRRRLGDSVPGCLLMIALVLGGGIWGYFKFFHYVAIAKAGERSVTFKEKDNPSAYLEYGRRMRASFSGGSKSLAAATVSMVRDFKKGRWKDDANGFDEFTKTFINDALAVVKDFDGQRVPTRLIKPHKKIAYGFRYAYECVLLLREAQAAEGPVREGLVKQAQEKAKECWKNIDQGNREFTKIWETSGGV